MIREWRVELTGALSARMLARGLRPDFTSHGEVLREVSMNGVFRVPEPVNEPVKSFAPGSPERASLKAKVKELKASEIEIPLIIGGHEVERAITAARDARHAWSRMPWVDRAAIFLRAAELLSGPWRETLNGATMLGQSKTAHQAEIDAACEVIDFWRFNVRFMQEIYGNQPISSPGVWNRVEYRGLDGFVFAVTPFNFTSIGANLPTSPAMMGNTVLWKPASTGVYPAYQNMRMLIDAGLPAGVINLVVGSGGEVGDPVLASPEFAGLHFTGSTAVFQSMWKAIGANMPRYRTYPRIVGETGGKDFVFAHASADVEALVSALVRGAFEYQGQKCSAASRAYIPRSLWPVVKELLLAMVAELKVGDVEDFTNFMGAVIDQAAFESIKEYIEFARASSDAEVLAGGVCDDSVGYFIQPTVVLTTDPKFRLLQEEIFGPVLTLFVYEDDRLDEALELCDTGSPYALTGSVFGRDRQAILKVANALRDTAGNFYINDKPTGAVVGQQPFGGARASGTNDKAGSMWNLIRWASPRSIKETFVPQTGFRYPFMQEP
jgi:1-pyrroline-5-carboxylate dehydrogenase